MKTRVGGTDLHALNDSLSVRPAEQLRFRLQAPAGVAARLLRAGELVGHGGLHRVARQHQVAQPPEGLRQVLALSGCPENSQNPTPSPQPSNPESNSKNSQKPEFQEFPQHPKNPTNPGTPTKALALEPLETPGLRMLLRVCFCGFVCLLKVAENAEGSGGVGVRSGGF